MILDSIVDMVCPVGEMKRQPAYRQSPALNLIGQPFPHTDSAPVLEAELDVTGRAVAPHGWVIIAD